MYVLCKHLFIDLRSSSVQMIIVSKPTVAIGKPTPRRKKKDSDSSSSDSNDDEGQTPTRVRGVRKARPGSGLENVEAHIRPYMADEIEPTIYDWLGRLFDIWKLDYEPHEEVITFSDALKQAHDAVCEDHRLASPWDKIRTSCIFYKRVCLHSIVPFLSCTQACA